MASKQGEPHSDAFKILKLFSSKFRVHKCDDYLYNQNLYDQAKISHVEQLGLLKTIKKQFKNNYQITGPGY